MSLDESITVWLAGLEAGDSCAVQRLWEDYFFRLVGLARKILQDVPRQVADEEDVALSAFKSFCHRAAQGQFPRLEDRDDLWKLLMTITVRKALRVRRKSRREADNAAVEQFREQIANREPSPAFAALVKDEFQRLIDMLHHENLQETAVLKMQGYTNREIADHFGRSVSYVERKLQLIRRVWSEEGLSPRE